MSQQAKKNKLMRKTVGNHSKSLFVAGKYLFLSIKSILDKPKDSNSRKGTIYKISCVECQQVYVGEIDRSFNTPYRKHKRNVRNELLGNFTGQTKIKTKQL